MSNVRDEELSRLEKYAKGLGISKITYKGPSGDATGAEWVVAEDNSVELVFYKYSRISKRMLILNFVHELGHHLSWIYKGKKDNEKLNKALMKEDARKIKDPVLPKNQRKLIYLMEKEDSEYRESIWKEVGIALPIEYLYADIECDNWYYKQYYLTGKHPTHKETKKKYREIRTKYGIK